MYIYIIYLHTYIVLICQTRFERSSENDYFARRVGLVLLFAKSCRNRCGGNSNLRAMTKLRLTGAYYETGNIKSITAIRSPFEIIVIATASIILFC